MTLESMDTDTREEILTYLKEDEEESDYGKTVFEYGIDRAFKIFENSSQKSSNCNRILIFLTDGNVQIDIERIVKANNELERKVIFMN